LLAQRYRAVRRRMVTGIARSRWRQAAITARNVGAGLSNNAHLSRVDDPAVRHRRDRRDPGPDQPGVPHRRTRVRRQPGGHPPAGGRPILQNVRLYGNDRGRPAGVPRPAM